jgi:DNA (cytosine-5)-methyltransferase 1
MVACVASGGSPTLAVVEPELERRGRCDSGRLVAVDLFCGAGGLSKGLEMAGLDVVAHVDHWTPAVDTLNRNFGEAHEPTDVTALTARDIRRMVGRVPDVLAGGPPCQSFTSAGPRRTEDVRGTMVRAYAQLASELRPSIVVFENVEGFITAGAGRFVFDLLDPLLEAGYKVALRKVNLANYGVPQHRKRVIAVASLLADPPFPEPSHSAWGAPGAEEVAGKPQTPTVAEALGGLPAASAAGAPTGHEARRLSELEARRVRALGPGQTMRDLPEELWHGSYRKRAFRRVQDGTPTERRGGAPAGLRRLRGDAPSKAITSAAVREFIHPVFDRRLTLREAARLQTFPDDFIFAGNFSEQATLIGNAVPPRFAEALGQAVIRHLAAPRVEAVGQPRKGALLEFSATNGSGMSPALANVVNQVRDRYVAEPLFA